MMLRKILIVEDNSMNRALLQKMLSDEYSLLEAENGEQALAVLREKHHLISAVLLDLLMPVMDGFEVLSVMRADPELSRIPVIVATGTAEENAEVRAVSLGANDFVTKPYNPTLIRHCLRNTIKLRETASAVNALRRDRLTGLYSRDTFFERAAELIAEHEPGRFVMSCFDVDNFKIINDQYGVSEGDRVLRCIGAAIDDDMRAIDGLACRVSADNFASLFETKHLRDDFLTTLRYGDVLPESLRASTTFSVGRCVVTDVSLSPSALYDRAYIAKRSVKGRYDRHIAFFDESMRERLLREQEIVGEMDDALKTGQFEIWLQPQLNHATGALIGSEALVRWRHPRRGLVPPGDFIPVFERNGFIYELDKFVWEAACALLRGWTDEGRAPLPISVNISRYDIVMPDLFEVLAGLVEKYALPVGMLRLEITESAFADSEGKVISAVQRLVDHGFTVEIDDFGSGYSSLNTLKDVPAQVLKLDMRFLEGGGRSRRGGNILESVVRMAKWLDMSVIAEGVETIEQADYLKSIGCTYVQGYLYARPMSADDYLKYSLGLAPQRRIQALETAPNLDNNAFWDPSSMDTLIFNSYVGGACILEYDGRRVELLRVTDKLARILGGDSTEEALKFDIMERLSPESRAELLRALEAAVASGEERTGEFLLLDLPCGRHETYLSMTLRAIASAGVRHLIYCTGENITAQRQAERRVRESAELLQAIMSGVGSGVSAMLVGEAGGARILFANEQNFAIFGCTREQYEREGLTPLALMHPDDRERVRGEVAALLKSRGSATFDYRARTRGGREISIRSRTSVTAISGLGDSVLISVINLADG